MSEQLKDLEDKLTDYVFDNRKRPRREVDDEIQFMIIRAFSRATERHSVHLDEESE